MDTEDKLRETVEDINMRVALLESSSKYHEQRLAHMEDVVTKHMDREEKVTKEIKSDINSIVNILTQWKSVAIGVTLTLTVVWTVATFIVGN